MFGSLWGHRDDDGYTGEEEDDANFSLQQENVTSESFEIEKEDGISWKQQHYSYCQEHGILAATVQQIIKPEQSFTRPNVSECILLEDESAAVAAIVEEQLKRTQQKESTTARPSMIWSLANQVYSVVVKSGNGDEYQPDEDDLFTSGQASSQPVKWKESILCVEWAVKLSETLVAEAPVVLFRNGDDSTDTLLGWIQSCKPLLYRLPLNQVDLLIKVLIKTEKAKLIDDVIVFGSDAVGSSDIPVALFRIQHALQKRLTTMNQWSKDRDDALQRARNYKTRNNSKMALQELKRKALYEAQIATSEHVILNLQQVQHALETVQSQAESTKLLESAKFALAETSQHVTLQDVDNMALDLQEEYQNLQLINDALTSTTPSVDEEDLLKELEALTIDSSSQDNHPGTPMNTSTKTTLKTISNTQSENKHDHESADPTKKKLVAN